MVWVIAAAAGFDLIDEQDILEDQNMDVEIVPEKLGWRVARVVAYLRPRDLETNRVHEQDVQNQEERGKFSNDRTQSCAKVRLNFTPDIICGLAFL